jgi:hypothetical protein
MAYRNLSDTNPPAQAGKKNVKFQLSAAYTDGLGRTVMDISAEIDANGVVGVEIDGGATTPPLGSKHFRQIPFAGSIVGWRMVSDAAGSAQITVKKCSNAGFPTTASIVAAAPPSLSSEQIHYSTTLTGWTTTFAADDWFEFVLDSVVTCKWIQLQIFIVRG